MASAHWSRSSPRAPARSAVGFELRGRSASPFLAGKGLASPQGRGGGTAAAGVWEDGGSPVPVPRMLRRESGTHGTGFGAAGPDVAEDFFDR